MMKLTNRAITRAAQDIALELTRIPSAVKLFGIPRGGVPAAYAILAAAPQRFVIVDEAEEADVLIDDLVDSGETMRQWCDRFPGKHFRALFTKSVDFCSSEWLIFPWEGEAASSFEDNVRRMLQFVGEDPKRGGLVDTPARVAEAWQYWCSGYGTDPNSILKVFEDGADGCDEMVVVKDIPFYSHCEHHLAPIFGTVTIGYIPCGYIVGLSKLSRLTEMFARRLQVQERMTNQIADTLFRYLEPKGVGIVVKARHLCMESRGVCQQGHSTITSALRGAIRTDASARAEFLSLTRS